MKLNNNAVIVLIRKNSIETISYECNIIQRPNLRSLSVSEVDNAIATVVHSSISHLLLQVIQISQLRSKSPNSCFRRKLFPSSRVVTLNKYYAVKRSNERHKLSFPFQNGNKLLTRSTKCAGDIRRCTTNYAPSLLSIGIHSLLQHSGVKLTGKPSIFLRKNLVLIKFSRIRSGRVRIEVEIHSGTRLLRSALWTKLRTANVTTGSIVR